jgi:Ca2+-binding EF-hand superfamily protein
MTLYTADELVEYRQVFALFDTDGSGAIGTDELGEAMRSMGMNANQKELEQLIREASVNFVVPLTANAMWTGLLDSFFAD